MAKVCRNMSTSNKYYEASSAVSLAKTYGEEIYSLPEDLRKLFRKYENVNKKLINIKWSIEFNSTCLKENILPNYSRIRHHDPAIAKTMTTLKYRRYIIDREITNSKKKKDDLQKEKLECENSIKNFQYNIISKENVMKQLKVILLNSDNVAKSRMMKKLKTLYQGHPRIVNDNGNKFMIKDPVDCFTNLSSYELSEDEKEFLNLGLNCHIEPKYNKLHKKVEIEVLYQNLLKLESKQEITIDPKLADQLRCESTKHRYEKRKTLLTPELKAAAKTLRENSQIMIRKADKSSMYVILDKEEYLEKMDFILSDNSKFKRITRNPTEEVQQKANKFIEALNAAQDDLKLPKIIGDFKPGHIYGNVKTHKTGYPLRPIISQIPTPTYNLAKSLNQIISPYMPDEFCLKSSSDFIDLLETSKPEGIIASLDIESLFTNVPIDDTIDMILDETYNHPHLPPPKIPPYILKELLNVCTKEAPFRCPKGNLYVQVEGVAMGSPLGPVFANFYMGKLEKTLFSNSNIKPSIYARYVDDIFVQVKNEEELKSLKELFQSNSKLKFTFELSSQSKLPFLDILIEQRQNTFNTKVYHKPTDKGHCLNGESECVDKYKISVILSYLNRAYKVCKTWHEFHIETVHIKQRLINNNYTNTMIDSEIKKFLTKKHNTETKENKKPITVYYENQTHINYKTEERVIKDIVYNNVKCVDPNNKLDLIIYYRNNKTSNLVMKNNLAPPTKHLQQTNVIYEFTCPMSHSQVTQYIGFTQTTLSQRLTSHAQNGSILNHFKQEHHIKPTREQLTENTKILSKSNDRLRLAIKESFFILDSKPEINKQFDNFTNVLKLHNPRTQHNKKQHTKTKTDILDQTINTTQPQERNQSQEIEDITPDGQNVPAVNLIQPEDPNQSQEVEDTTPVGPNVPSQNYQEHQQQNEDSAHTYPHPLGPFSQRTHRLLTSPIKLNRLQVNLTNNDNLAQSNLLNISSKPHTQSDSPQDSMNDNNKTDHHNESDLEDTSTIIENSLPDMETILATKFGIDNNSQDNTQESQNIENDIEYTISQRLKTFKRATKTHITYCELDEEDDWY